MKTITATHLKNHLGDALQDAALEPLAIVRHGRVVAYLVPAAEARTSGPAPDADRQWGRAEEERLFELCASGDLRPSRWQRAGNADLLAGVAVMLASLQGFDRKRLLALAEHLSPGMSRPDRFGRWLATTPVHAARFLPMLKQRMEEAHQ